MRRRKFIALLGGAVIAWPYTARAQQSMPVVGLLSGTNREARLIGAIWQGLGEAGFVEGQNAAMEYRFAEGRFERLPAMAAELADKKAAVIIGIQSAAAPIAAKNLMPPVPVVFSIGGDPVRLALVSSLARPGGNVTGATFLVNSLSAKRLELLHDMLPGVTTMGLLVNPKNPAAAPETADVQAAARTLGLQLVVQNASSPQDIDAAVVKFVEQKVGAITFAADATFNAARAQLIALAAQHRLPTMYFYREFANDGGLVSYGGYDTDAYRLAGVYAGRILKGEKPADLPVQQVTKVELVINLRTAKTLGLSIPLPLLGRADDVIE
jgi:putative tryptophan/tyrosine transport system substrate-binding protein